MPNPFETLGITKEAIRGMSHGQIVDLTRRARNNLQSIFHPDRFGDPKRFMEITEAFEQIDVQQEENHFDFWLKKLTTPIRHQLRDELEEHKKKMDKIEASNVSLRENFMCYLQDIANGHRLIENDLPDTDWWHRYISALAPPEGTTIFLELSVLSVAQERASLGTRMGSRPITNLVVEKGGSLATYSTVDPAKRKKAQKYTNFISGLGSRTLERDEEQTLAGVRLIGALSRDYLDVFYGTKRAPIDVLLEYHQENVQKASAEGYPPEIFANFLHCFHPFCKEGDILVGVRQTEKETCFIPLGSILKVTMPHDSFADSEKPTIQSDQTEADTSPSPRKFIQLDAGETVRFCYDKLHLKTAQTARSFAVDHKRDPKVFEEGVKLYKEQKLIAPATKRVTVSESKERVEIFWQEDLQKVLEWIPDVDGRMMKTYTEPRPARTLNSFLQEAERRGTPIFRSALLAMIHSLKIKKAPLVPGLACISNSIEAVYWEADLERAYQEYCRNQQKREANAPIDPQPLGD